MNSKSYGIYQSKYWAQFQISKGWMVYESHLFDKKIYIYYKKFTFIYIIWIPGLCLDTIKYIDNAIERLRDKEKIKIFYTRINILDLKEENLTNVLLKNKWKRPLKYIGGIESFRVDIKPDIHKIINKCSGNWRHNYKRSFRNNLSYGIWNNPDPSIMTEIIKSMEKVKGLSINYSFKDLKKLLYYFKDKLIICRAVNDKGVTIAYRAAIIDDSKIAWDFIAAGNEEARKTYASYGLVMELINQCKKESAEIYDFSGVDKKNNLGVYNFKKGIGIDIIEYMGEYEKGNFALRFAVSILLILRKID